MIQLPNGDWIDPAIIVRVSMYEVGGDLAGTYRVSITTPTAHGPMEFSVMRVADPLKAAAERDRLAKLANAARERETA